jgi:hypothetical protein
VTRAAVALGAAAAVLAWSPALAQVDEPHALVFVIDGTTFTRFVDRPPVSGVVGSGGIAMLRGSDPSITAIDALEAAGVPIVDIPPVGPPQVPISRVLEGFDEELLVVVIGLASTDGIVDEGPDAVLLASGAPASLLGRHHDAPLATLTSDSTRRDGVVTPSDVVATVEEVADVNVPRIDGGNPIAVVDSAPPVELYRKYLQYRTLSAPIQTAIGVWEVAVGGLAVWALASRRAPAELRRLVLAASLSLPVLFLALLGVGHLPSLTYLTVLPVLVGVTIVAGVMLLWVADRSGIGVALAWAGGIGLGGLVIESLVDWDAAFAPMLGGSHLDGARFFGMPNVEIGLALGGATFVAARFRVPLIGAGFLALTGLWAGLPWFGSNLGASITLFAAAGLWWGIRAERGWLPTAAGTAGCVLVGAALVIFAHRELTDAPTHITRFAASPGGVSGIFERVIDRLQIGLRLLTDQPPALIPVVGTPLALLFVMRRPPAPLRAGFEQEPSARPAAITILIASIVAYLANDTGAAALGLGFGVAMVCLFAVSLASTREMMDA